MLTDPQGITMPPGVIIEGGLLLNAKAERFIDETDDIAGMMHAVLAQPGAMAWVLADARIEAACAAIPELAALIELNAARTADTLPALAERLGLEPAPLEATLAHAHAAQQSGRPDRFGRNWGKDRPPIPPYRAWRVTGALYHTQGGLQTDAEGQVLRPDGSRFSNLFAAGGSARGVSGPSSWGYLPAMGLCAAVTTGRLAGEAAARLVATRPICPDKG
jgi:fumarate reductase flavoprotein subunit